MAKKKPQAKARAKPQRVTYKDWETSEQLAILEGWARDGLTDEDIAGKVGITRTTIYSWKHKSPAIADALKNGKEVSDYRVEKSLYQRATGYTTKTKRTIITVATDGKKSQRVLVEEIEHAPDVSAAIFWLKNRRPDKWRRMAPAFERKTAAEAEKMEAEIKKLYLEIEELEREQGAATGQPVIIVDSWGNIADEVNEALAAETNEPEEGPDNA